MQAELDARENERRRREMQEQEKQRRNEIQRRAREQLAKQVRFMSEGVLGDGCLGG